MPSLDDYRWLTGPDAAAWLSQCAQGPPDSLVTLTQRLRGQLSPAQTHLVLEQTELRERAREKFAAAAGMFFTRQGYEQATDEIVAGYKAGRFAVGEPVADLCCGIGGDLLALARRGLTVGIDRDPAVALFAAANCQRAAANGSAGHVVVADVKQQSVAPFAAWHLDPDRRPQGRRTTRAELHEPGIDTIERLLTERPDGAIKLAPAATWPDDWTHRAQWEWISRGGECRQLMAWFGRLAQSPGRRQATILGEEQETPRIVRGEPGQEMPVAATVGRYVFEPDAAVLAADLTGALAAENGLTAVAAGNVYLTGDSPQTDRALACFEVTDVLPYHPHRVRALLQERGIGRLEIKKRGVPIEPEQIRRELRCEGEQSATLLLTRIGRTVTVIVAKRVYGRPL